MPNIHDVAKIERFFKIGFYREILFLPFQIRNPQRISAYSPCRKAVIIGIQHKYSCRLAVGLHEALSSVDPSGF